MLRSGNHDEGVEGSRDRSQFTESGTSSSCLCSGRTETCVLSASYVVVMPKKRQALVEFEDVLGACNAVNYAADNQIYIAGHPAFVNYSTSQKISRPGDSDDSRSVNSVLLFTILNPIYSITTVRASEPCFRCFCEIFLLPFLFPHLSQIDLPVPFHLARVLFTGCSLYYLQSLWPCPENCYFPEEWCPGHGGISFVGGGVFFEVGCSYKAPQRSVLSTSVELPECLPDVFMESPV